MEIAGLAVGIAGLAGLFSTCADVLERVDAYKDFGITSHQLSLRFESEKIRLQEWANAVGIDDNTVKNQHHPKLDDPRIRKIVERFLVHIRDIVSTAGHLSDKNLKNPKLSNVGNDPWVTSEPDRAFSSSKWTKARWALGREARFTKIVEGLEVVVEKLYTLVPLEIVQTVESSPIATLLDQDNDQSSVFLDIDRELRSLIEDIRKKASLENLRLIDDVLRPPKIPDQLEVHLKAKLENTCDWVLQSSVYQEWLSEDVNSTATRFLWLYGPSGCGKTILCSNIIESFNKTHAPFVFHFFSTLYVQADGKPEDIIRVWISQIARVNQTTLDLVYTELSVSVFSLTLSSADLWRIFTKVVSQLEHCVFVVDGLDEYGSIDMVCEDFLIDLKQAFGQTSSAILVTSRDEPEIRTQLAIQDTSDGALKLYWHSITKEDNFADVHLYSQHIVKQKLWKKDANLQRDLALQLAERCDGMFLWVSMSGKELRSGLSRSRLERIVGEVPKGLLPTYERNWQRILGQGHEDKARSLKILQWCTFSTRPLTVAELTEALIVDVSDGKAELDLEELPEEIDSEYIDTEIKNLCGSLIEVKSPSPTALPSFMTIQLVHSSVKEFLLSTMSTSGKGNSLPAVTTESMQHGELAKICLHYLCYTNVEPSNKANDWNSNSRAFRQYALDNWIIHYRVSSTDDTALHNLAARFLDHKNANFRAWASEHEDHELFPSLEMRPWAVFKKHPQEKIADSLQESHLGSPLYYAALFGLDACMEILYTRDGFVVDESGGRLSTALQATCLHGQSTAFNTLIQWGADVDIDGQLFGTALGAASFFGRTEFVRKLLDRTTKINEKGWTGNTPLWSAAANDYREIVTLLLDKGAAINISDHYAWTPLTIATYYGRLEIVQLLLDRDPDVEAEDKTGWRPLAIAAALGCLQVVHLLLEQGGADVRAIHSDGYTPLYIAIERGHSEVACLLLDYDSEIDILTRNGETALNIAARTGDIKIAKILIDRGGKGNVDQWGRMPLHRAVDKGYMEIVRLLLDQKAGIDTLDDKGCTPLIFAILRGHSMIIRLLLEHGCDVEAHGFEGLGPLHYAASIGSFETVRLLLERGAAVQAVNHGGWTPLNLAALNNQLDVARLLLDHNADVQIASKEGWTPIHTCAMEGSVEILRLLLDRCHDDKIISTNESISVCFATRSDGQQAAHIRCTDNPSIDNPDEMGRTPLLIASFHGHFNIARLLLDRGSDLSLVDSGGMDALILSVSNGHDEIWQLLLDRGAVLSTRDHDGRSCLHYAAAAGHIKAVKMLLDRGIRPFTELDNDHMNALHHAAKGGQLDVVKLLILHVDAENLPTNNEQSGFELLRLVDLEGRNALHFAAGGGNVKLLDYLMEHDFDVMVKDKVGKSLLDYACLSGSEEMVERVLQLDIYSRPRIQASSWSPIHWACRVGSPGIVHLLARENIIFEAVETSQPTASWLPCDVARYFSNSKLISEDGSFLGEHVCKEMHRCQSDTPSANTLGPASRVENRICDGCEGDIYGMRFNCRDCHAASLDYCLMCKRDLESLHLGHQWDCRHV